MKYCHRNNLNPSETETLSLRELGAYHRLLAAYFHSEEALPNDWAILYRICRATTRDERIITLKIVDRFFSVSALDGLLHSEWVDRELAKAKPRIEAARSNGKKGGRPSTTRAIP
jgi:uncharacterized protein YdaU (DUF1376 family)